MEDHENAASIRIVPANQATWDDVQQIFGQRGEPAGCQCQRYKLGWHVRHEMDRDELRFRLRDQTECGHPEAPDSSGLVAFVDGEPAGWCAIEPRPNYPYLTRTVWAGRKEDPADERVWSVTCFVVRAGFRRRGITYELAKAAVDFAGSRGAKALEAYPIITHPDQEITWGDLHVGAVKVFTAAGFREVRHPTKRRYIMRIDF